MPRYNVPVSWEEYGWCDVEAANPEEAIDRATCEDLPDGTYVDDSMNVDEEVFRAELEDDARLKKEHEPDIDREMDQEE